MNRIKRLLTTFSVGFLMMNTAGCGDGNKDKPFNYGKDPTLDVNPLNDGNDGPIDGIWERTYTKCSDTSTFLRTGIEKVRYYINNTSGRVVLNYENGLEVSFPAQISYDTSQKTAALKRIDGKFFCSGDLAKCETYVEPNSIFAQFGYDKKSGTLSLSFSGADLNTNDFMCVGYSSSAKLGSTVETQLKN